MATTAPVKSHKRRRTQAVLVRMLPAEAEVIRRNAAEQGVSISELFRRSAMDAVKP